MSGTYKIGEAAALLQLKTYVLRFWETEFPDIVPLRTEKGQRLYTEEHLALLERIRYLLHDRGLTISGARKVLDEEKELGLRYVFGLPGALPTGSVEPDLVPGPPPLPGTQALQKVLQTLQSDGNPAVVPANPDSTADAHNAPPPLPAKAAEAANSVPLPSQADAADNAAAPPRDESDRSSPDDASALSDMHPALSSDRDDNLDSDQCKLPGLEELIALRKRVLDSPADAEYSTPMERNDDQEDAASGDWPESGPPERPLETPPGLLPLFSAAMAAFAGRQTRAAVQTVAGGDNFIYAGGQPASPPDAGTEEAEQRVALARSEAKALLRVIGKELDAVAALLRQSPPSGSA